MLSRFKSILFESIKNKRLHVFSLFFLLAFLILVLSKLSNTYTETLAVDLEIINLKEDRVLISEQKPKLDLVVNAHGFQLLGSYFSNRTIKIDLEKDAYEQNESYIWLANRALPEIENQLGQSFKVVSVQPDSMILPFGTLAVRKVPIRLIANVNYAAGYDTLEGLKIDPDSVKVIGPEQEIKDINFVETTKFVLDDIKNDINSSISLKLPIQGSKINLSSKQTSVQAKVDKFTEGTLDIPVLISNLPSDVRINFFPKTIKVSFEVNLSEYKSIKPTDFKIECDYLEGLNSSLPYLTPQLKKIPDNVKRVKLKQDRIEYIITE